MIYFTIYDLVYNLCINVTPIFVCRKVSRAFGRSCALVSLHARRLLERSDLRAKVIRSAEPLKAEALLLRGKAL